MRLSFKKYLILPILGVLVPLAAQAEVLMQWNRIPLRVDLHVGKERIVFFDKNVRVGLPPEVDGKIEVQSTGGAVYFKATETFDLSRIQFRDMESNQLILIDMKAIKAKGKPDNVRVLYSETVTNSTNAAAQTEVADGLPEQRESALPTPAALTRYAAQSLYAPKRTIEPLEGVKRVAVKLPKTISNLMPKFLIQGTPLEAWGLNGYVVTAVRIKNLENIRIQLDPRYLQGYFYAATFQHNWLGENGTPEDTTVVYLVTEGRPENAFIPMSQMVSGKKQAVKKSQKNTNTVKTNTNAKSSKK